MSSAFGVFDGIHKGHQALLALKPKKIYLGPLPQSSSLTTSEEREALISKYAGKKGTVSYSESPSKSESLLLYPDAAEYALLTKEYLEKSTYTEPVLHHELPITSERIRMALEAGEVEEAEAMLGYSYTLTGEVVYGRQLGRTVGMPTVNLKIAPEKLLPKHGVYGSITIVDGVRYLGVTSIGLRPTVDDLPHITIETFLVHFNRDLYGQQVSLELKTYIRPITKFESLEAVRQKVDEDVRYVVEKHYE
jgi:riboflavin kinase/FMN adenylyltransferase